MYALPQIDSACIVLKIETNLTSINRRKKRTGMKSNKIRMAIRLDAVNLAGIYAPYVRSDFMFDDKLPVLLNLKKN